VINWVQVKFKDLKSCTISSKERSNYSIYPKCSMPPLRTDSLIYRKAISRPTNKLNF